MKHQLHSRTELLLLVYHAMATHANSPLHNHISKALQLLLAPKWWLTE